ncbi:hypothetical protein B0H14DRAFT_443819 [Mycena olivaceomarginata]|nr:hypothetical protein B0H14DRAFT_443819 [Mycena olivaceomarginata]
MKFSRKWISRQMENAHRNSGQQMRIESKLKVWPNCVPSLPPCSFLVHPEWAYRALAVCFTLLVSFFDFLAARSMLAGAGSELAVNSTSDPGLMFSVFWSMEQNLSSIFTFSVGRSSTTSRRSTVVCSSLSRRSPRHQQYL